MYLWLLSFSNFGHKIELLIKHTSIPGSFYNPVRLHQIIFIISNCIIIVEANNFKLCVHSSLHYNQVSYFVLGDVVDKERAGVGPVLCTQMIRGLSLPVPDPQHGVQHGTLIYRQKS